ncbi:hypothetical protein HPB50_010042 [Hyalomma asiaticum]|uniref:Uncharacterized protein n=1 Tax=Hyalomma asiaticum TaxID=266040 RepID=A0ACB7S1P2_HYAAI|nr:hypothetical protein HPB50_010042 [Hyalomma asiaticum]
MRILLQMLIADFICATPAVLASTPIVPSTLPRFATASAKSRNNGTLTEASRPQEGATSSNATSSDANGTSIPEESERVLNHLMRLMESLNHVPYLEALSRGTLHDKDKIPVINEAVKELKVGAHDNATLSVTLYESPQEGGEALPTMQKEFIFVRPPANASQDLAPEAGNLHGHVSPPASHSVGGHESQGYRYGQWAAGGRTQKHEQHGRQSAGGAHRHLEDAHGKVHKERGHDKGGQAERKYRVRTEIEYFEREKFKDDEHDKLKAAHQSKTSTDAIKGADRFASQGHQSHQRHLGGGYAQGTHVSFGCGNKGVDGGSRGFSQKDAQKHEEYHHEAGSQGFTDKDKGHQRAGWRERGYRIIAEKEYVDKDKHHDKAYGVDNQEQGHRLRSQGQHGHKQGHDDIKKEKEHYSRGVHDSAHHEKAHKHGGAYGKTYQVDGSAVHPTGTRDHLSSSTDKVAELEAGNATNSPDDESRRKKVIRIRVLSKTPGVASVTVGGRATNTPPEALAGYGGPEDDVAEAAGQNSPPKDISQIGNSYRSPGSVPGSSSTDSTRTPKKHFVPMEVLAGLYTEARGETPLVALREKPNVSNQPYLNQVHRPVVYNLGPTANSRELYNEKSFQPVVANPGLREQENRAHANQHHGTAAYRPPSDVFVAGSPAHQPPSAETTRPAHYGQQGYIPGPPPRLTSSSRGNPRAQTNVATGEGFRRPPHFVPNAETAISAISPYPATSEGQGDKNVRLFNTQVNNGQEQLSAYGNPRALDANQVTATHAVYGQPQNTRISGYPQYPENSPAHLAQQQQAPAPAVRTPNAGYPGQVTSRPNIPYANSYIVPGQDSGTVPAVQVSAYPAYIEGSAALPEIYRTSIEKPGVQGGYSPSVDIGVSGYHGSDSPAVEHYVVYPGVQEASQIVPVGHEKDEDGRPKRPFNTFGDTDVNSLPTLRTSGYNENRNDMQLNDAGTENANESDDASRSICQEGNCTQPIQKPPLNQLVTAKTTAVSRHFNKMKKPFTACQTSACSQGGKCSRKDSASGLCSSKKESSKTSPVNAFSKVQKESVIYGRPKGRSEEELSSEATEDSDQRAEGQTDKLKSGTTGGQALITAGAQPKAARPTQEGMGYRLDVAEPTSKPLQPSKIIKIVKKDYFSQPLRLSSGGNITDDGLWHAKPSAS